VKESSQAKYSKYAIVMRKWSRTCNDGEVCPLRAVHGERSVGKRVSRGRALVASADEAWAIRGLEGTGGEARHCRVLSDEGRGGGDERGWTRKRSR